MNSASAPLEPNLVASWVEGGAEVLSSALLVGFATYVLIRVVRAFAPGKLCDPSPETGARERGRKLQSEPVPLVGGLALLVGLVVSGSVAANLGFQGLGWPWPGAVATSAAFALAFAVGLLDDWLPRGLSPGRKFVGQCLAGLPLGYGMWLELAGTFESPVLALFGLLTASACMAAIALNAINTFDNANGAATGLSAVAMAMCSPAAAGALLGFLPFNLRANSKSERGQHSTPLAYLGDSGSHLLGMWILVTPLAWPVLTLPLIDLARLAVERARSGRSPFRGDRCHLAHLLAARGLGDHFVLTILAGTAAPSILFGAAGLRAGRVDWLLIGIGATTFAYVTFFVAVRYLGQATSKGKDRRTNAQGAVAEQASAYLPVKFERAEEINEESGVDQPHERVVRRLHG